ncbi:unnamed protein product [Brachionus calyciflorus]|uniref:ISXO2-like transposase domain-containing protein n=1 Tax=Brachionus calyciflorus TaxID=104777 RepID=A0A813U6U5_9BILA|nr:unnamed protein product [Brachionus calyciflorus]
MSLQCLWCTTYKTIYNESFYSIFRKPLKIVLAIIKCSSAQITILKTVTLIKLNIEHNVHRNTISGNDKIVEIDESLYAKAKRSKGKYLKRPQVWTFGLLERRDGTTNGKVYLEVVPNREAQTLLAIIYEKVLSGTTIMSDCWSSYEKISRLRDYQHLTVNHTYYFMDLVNGACTKHRFKDMRGTKRSEIRSYLDEFIGRF